MKYFTRHELLILKAKIKGLAAEGTRTRNILRKKRGKEREKYWELKKQIGKEARYYLIAYGLLRGVSYSDIEPNSNKEQMNRWNFDIDRLTRIIHDECPYPRLYAKQWTPKVIQEYIFGEAKKEAA